LLGSVADFRVYLILEVTNRLAFAQLKLDAGLYKYLFDSSHTAAGTTTTCCRVDEQ